MTWTRECLAAIPDTSISGRREARETDGAGQSARQAGHDRPPTTAPSFTCNAMLTWSEDNQIAWHFIAPGKPMQNGFLRELQRPDAR